MTSRQAGRRISTIAAEKRRRGGVRGGTRQAARRKAAPLSSKERQRLVQLVICGSVFVLLVAAKLLLPEKMAQMNRQLAGALEQNMDVRTVFSAVGRAFSGEADLGGAAQEVYQAVFHPQAAGEALETAALGELADGAALGTLQPYRKAAPESLPESQPESEAAETPQAASLAYVLYSDKNLPEGVSMEQAILNFDYCTPVSGVLSSNFGYREHPVEGEERFHYGVDLAANTGTAIGCFADGTVKAVGESSSYGKYCIVDHAGGYSTLYAHCSRVTVSAGTGVTEGQKIAEVGETGMATGPHLHFELHRDGVYLNPIYYVSLA
ncbi:M23 family metallopeptidase [uncultured Oscillibacter sp.]|uniref:M23 family metallopeptidase n=1 Tax=uncultured Oscillibacter sp. TaxID=876091 RepID=UPI0025E88C98|nr:M23 family metallopeptidase [uncultured Oscillibacter sp.]